ncbi:Nicotinamide mononucleotide transporter [Streptomyces venezuelae]|nr:Nicotinamide mononucleotide transporter [Streptomyces venezuelae]QPK44719.1 hypothetical protein H4W23_08905 [Streptomyces gardneri]CUM42298.1 hypothetical protein BN2537_13561 [Streptomyces venezuelae]
MSLAFLFIALAACGRRTWTHGGGPGSGLLPVRRIGGTGWARPLAAGAVGAERAPTTGGPTA